MSVKPYPALSLSSKVESIPEALSVYVNNLIYGMKRRGDRITTLSLGEAYFDLPYFGFEDIDFKSGYHYSESLGLLDLRKKISAFYEEQYEAKVDSHNEIIISAGSKPLIYMALQTILEDGDEVLIHEPAWLSYPEQIRLAGGIPIFIPYNCSPSDFKSYINTKTKALILNNPNNPAGKAYAESELRYLYDLLRKNGSYIIVDEAYSDFVSGDEFVSMAKIAPDKDGVIIVNSLSKNLGISGWRVGYAISSPEIIYGILKLNQHLITCASTILLMYLAKHFDEILESTLPQAREVVRFRQEIVGYARDIGLATLGGCSTFYLFIDISKYGRSSLDLAMHLLMKYHIGVVPGSAYGESTDGFIRIGVGAETEKDVKTALDVIKRVVDEGEYDATLIDTELDRLNAHPFNSMKSNYQ
ncbi:pyridoxal phosphate-dependent aminotransferase [Paraeggerthella sp. Marseille-Q4926]|uniref:pyridoxal phosphate-dependent aminotransferase n=1 Tax=Paraeggerthella sp. Marseille-Q4926 TaxID=2866587 RepID=UPI001CE46747|nr:pyridoxal phosphate-dependent aminotransferase [Paraeggerthella sp. Marseille-Q4926]